MLPGSASLSWRIMPSGRYQRAVSAVNSSPTAPGPADASTAISGMAARGAPGTGVGTVRRRRFCGLRLGASAWRSSFASQPITAASFSLSL